MLLARSASAQTFDFEFIARWTHKARCKLFSSQWKCGSSLLRWAQTVDGSKHHVLQLLLLLLLVVKRTSPILHDEELAHALVCGLTGRMMFQQLRLIGNMMKHSFKWTECLQTLQQSHKALPFLRKTRN
jgi:hypothetical protein